MKILWLALAGYFCVWTSIQADDNIIRIYQDADLSNHAESSMAIQKGIEVAFDEINNEINGYKVEFKYLNHRGNVVRSKQNYQNFLDDDKALAIYSGIHSPPLIKNRGFINENKVLTLVPWAAGAPITRYPSPENWIFRLSIDDMYAGEVIVDFAMMDKQCKSPHLLLEATPWGDSNLKSMSLALKKYGITNPKMTRFGWNLSDQSARVVIREIAELESDCIILVSNAVEGTSLVQAVLDLPKEQYVPIISHWGITGGNFHEKITKNKRDMIDLSFIQSCFAFTNSEQTEFSNKIFNRLKKMDDRNIQSAEDLKSAVGFIHAYDLTKILIEAIKQAELSGDIIKDRNAVRLALESLNTPVRGLIKTYNKPYSVFHSENINAHEALDVEDFCIAEYGDKDEILIIQAIAR